MSDRNKELMEEVTRVTKLLKGPWILGGDFNVNPDLLREWAVNNRASIHCPEAPSCHVNMYDYFIVHRSLTGAVVGTQTISDPGGGPISVHAF